MDVEQALADCEAWTALPDANGAAHALAAEVTRMRQVIRDYVDEVESGEKFDALIGLVPGLVSDDGQYGA